MKTQKKNGEREKQRQWHSKGVDAGDGNVASTEKKREEEVIVMIDKKRGRYVLLVMVTEDNRKEK